MKKYKSEDNISYCLGLTLVIELIKNKKDSLIEIFLSSKYLENETLSDLIKQHNIKYCYNDKIFNILNCKENCFTIASFYKFKSPLDKNQDHLVLVNPSNMGNLGTIIRSCVGFNVNNLVIIKPCCDLFNPQTIRSSMGAIFHLNFELFDSFDDYLFHFKRDNIYPFMLDGAQNLHEVSFKKPATLVFGNEATGLSSSFTKYQSVVIKHNDLIDSLNLTIAIGISLYELKK